MSVGCKKKEEEKEKMTKRKETREEKFRL